jgi:hypothetical protein
MRKRQKPYVLIMFVLVAAGGVVFMSLAQSNPGQPKAPDTAPQTGSKDVQVPDKNTIKDTVMKAQAQSKKDAAVEKKKNVLRMDSEGHPQVNPDRPVVEMEKPAPYKPTPNASSTANQWWTDQSTKSYDAPSTPQSPGKGTITSAPVQAKAK